MAKKAVVAQFKVLFNTGNHLEGLRKTTIRI